MQRKSTKRLYVLYHGQPSASSLFHLLTGNFRFFRGGTHGLEPGYHLGIVCGSLTMIFLFFQTQSPLRSVICQWGQTAKRPGTLEWLTQFWCPGHKKIL